MPFEPIKEEKSTAAKIINPQKLDLVVQESRLKVQQVEEVQRKVTNNISSKLQAGIRTN